MKTIEYLTHQVNSGVLSGDLQLQRDYGDRFIILFKPLDVNLLFSIKWNDEIDEKQQENLLNEIETVVAMEKMK